MDCYIGIDVAKATLDIAALPSGESWTVTNDEAGLHELVPRLLALAPALVVLEATGGFESATVTALAQAGLPVVVANPRQVRDFAKALGRLAKTDALDAAILAESEDHVPAKRARSRTNDRPHPRRRLTGTGPAVAPRDCRAGRRRATPPRQRHLARKADDRGRSCARPCGALHGSLCKRPLESCAPSVLHPAAHRR